ncbi:MAG: response regulator [Magnetococcales bacterium]|nr:response regulator [Magnetococcales bacterium]
MKPLLLVEDSKSFGAVLKRRLEEALAVEVVWARSHAEAARLIQQQADAFALAVLDLNLPDAPDGQIVDFVLSQNIPAMVMTGEYKKETRARMMAKGILDYFVKDHINVIDTLIHTIQRIDKNRRFTLLVVDDSRSTRTLLSRFLQRYGFQILEAENGLQALELFDKQPIQIVLADYHMPGMDGFQLTRKIRARLGRNEVCVIGLSSQDDPDMAIHFIKAGANDFLTKSSQNEELLYRVLQNIEIIEHNLLLEQQIQERTNDIKERETFLENILGSALDAIITIDHQQKIVQFNPAAEMLFGYSKQAVLGQPVDILIPAEYRSQHQTAIARHRDQSGQFAPIYRRVEIPGLRMDGSCVDLDVGLTSVQSKGEVYYTAFMHDVTDRKQLMKSLKETLDVVESANRTKSEFLANMSHEIRTPLNAVIGLTDLALQQADISPKICDYLSKIAHSSKSLLHIINDILDFSRIEAGQLQFEQSDFLLQELLEQVAELFHGQMVAKQLAWRLHLGEAYAGTLVGDAMRLQQVLLNLVGNAIKFTEVGAIEVEVKTLQETTDRVTLQFMVQDSGIGIAAEQITRLFQPFTQVDNSATRQFGGTGLGLSISQRLVQQMEGHIWVVSEVGQGSQFYFTASFQRPAADHSAATPAQRPPRQHDPAKVRQRLGGARVLLVEDNAINRQVASEILAGIGLVVEVAADGNEAVAKVTETESKFDVVLMDIQMPHLDGYQATQKIRRDPRLQQLPIIAMTAHALAEDRAKSLAAGMNDHVTKPIDKNQLFSALLQWVDATHLPKAVVTAEPPRPDDGDEGLPEYISGIQLPQALERLNGNWRLLRSLLLEFGRDFADAGHKISLLLAGKRQDDCKTAERLAHSVKGMAGNIAARELFQAALALEQAIRKQHRPEWPLLLQAFQTSLDQVCAAIATLQPAATLDGAADGSDSSRAVDWDQVRPLLTELGQHLRNYNVLAQESLVALQPLLRGTALQQPLLRLEESLAAFDFEAALGHWGDISQEK